MVDTYSTMAVCIYNTMMTVGSAIIIILCGCQTLMPKNVQNIHMELFTYTYTKQKIICTKNNQIYYFFIIGFAYFCILIYVCFKLYKILILWLSSFHESHYKFRIDIILCIVIM